MVTAFMILTAVLNSLFFGDIASKIAELQSEAVAYQNEIDQANEVMNAIEVENTEDRYDIIDYLFLTKGTKKFQDNFDSLMDDLPTKIQLLLVEGIFMKIIIANNVIRHFISQAFRK